MNLNFELWRGLGRQICSILIIFFGLVWYARPKLGNEDEFRFLNGNSWAYIKKVYKY